MNQPTEPGSPDILARKTLNGGQGNRAYPDAYGIPWYVTDPTTGITQYVEADAESTARWLAWSRWRGLAPTNDRDQAEYDALEVIPAGNPTQPTPA